MNECIEVTFIDIHGEWHILYFDSSLFTINGYDSAFYMDKDENGDDEYYTFKKINDRWHMHSEDSLPAVITTKYCYFFKNGVSLRIEELPIDDEEKVILLLKYSYISNSEDFCHMYG